MRKLLIADCSEEYQSALTAALQGSYHVLCCHTGTEAWILLHQEHPDIFVLDLMLPLLDGVTLLERARSEGIQPLILAVTPFFSPYIESCAQRLGIQYLIRKPFEIDAIVARINDMGQRANSTSKADPVSYVTAVLLSLNFSTKHNGFSYLRESILRMSADPSQSITKALYPSVAHMFDCNKNNIERSIRTAMDYAWEHGDRNLWHHYFPDATQRPTNAVFISRITEALLLEE